MFSQISRAEYSFPSPHWDKVSGEAMDFIRRCLDPNPETRMTPVQGLHHPWMLSAEGTLDSDIDVDSVNFYRACQRFQHITRVVGTLYQLQNLVRHTNNSDTHLDHDGSDPDSSKIREMKKGKSDLGYDRLDDDEHGRGMRNGKLSANSAGDVASFGSWGEGCANGLKQKRRSLTDLLQFAVPASVRRKTQRKSLSDEDKKNARDEGMHKDYQRERSSNGLSLGNSSTGLSPGNSANNLAMDLEPSEPASVDGENRVPGGIELNLMANAKIDDRSDSKSNT